MWHGGSATTSTCLSILGHADRSTWARVWASEHLKADGASLKASTVRRIQRRGLNPQIDIIAHGLRDEETALRLEAAVIDALGLRRLTNQVRGWRSIELGRMPLRQLIAYYRPQPVTVREPSLLIRINQLYSDGMSDRALYDATRGVWRLNPYRSRSAQYAMAVFEGIVREVYAITSWHPAGTTKYETRASEDLEAPGRFEFVGRVAPSVVRRRYLDRSVRRYFPRGLQSPIRYVRC